MRLFGLRKSNDVTKLMNSNYAQYQQVPAPAGFCYVMYGNYWSVMLMSI